VFVAPLGHCAGERLGIDDHPKSRCFSADFTRSPRVSAARQLLQSSISDEKNRREHAGCPNASIEAMAAGLPIVATAVGGAISWAHDRIACQTSGWLIGLRNSE